MTKKKKFIVYQTLDITIGHLVEAESMDEAMNSIWDNGIDLKKIVMLDADYARPYDASEFNGEQTMTNEEIIGFFNELATEEEI